jgi:hypothetical protein
MLDLDKRLIDCDHQNNNQNENGNISGVYFVFEIKTLQTVEMLLKYLTLFHY